MSLPTGVCECGCGQLTQIATRTRASEGIKKGVPKRFVLGHNRRQTPNEYEVDDNGCWIWQRSIVRSGYGIAWRNGTNVLAHRWYYQRANGPIPDGYQLDHLCRNRACVNPEHLQPVSRRANVRRGANAHLSEAAAMEIRQRHAVSGLPVRTWSRGHAKEYGVTPACLRDLLRGKTWRDVSVLT